jgi:hypothetical protein
MALTKITTNIIADDAITADKIAAGAIDSTHLTGITTTDVTEGTNLYFTDARVGSYLTTNSYATESYVTTAVSNLVDAAPATLDTLNELAAALGDDANFSTTVTNSIATKVSKSGDTMTGDLTVEGTVTADGLDVDKATTASSGSVNLNSSLDSSVRFYNSSGATDERKMDLRYTAASGFEGLYIRAINDANNDFENIARFDTKTGDISFYEDTGTTAKFFWDASAERLGIGTTSPTRPLSISGPSAYMDFNSTNYRNYVIGSEANGFIIYDQLSATYRMVIDSSGNVGIGNTGNTSRKLDVTQESGQVAGVRVLNAGSGAYYQMFSGTANPKIGTSASTDQIEFHTDASGEAMRITSAGNVGIGTSSPSAMLHISDSADVTQLRLTRTVSGTSIMKIEGSGYLNIKNISGAGIQFGTNNTDYRMIIDTSGNVGIGNTSMSSFYSGTRQLVVGSGSGDQGITVYSGSSSSGYLGFNDALTTTVQGWVGYNHSADAMTFATSANERMRLDSSGNLGIGTSSPAAYLDVNYTSMFRGDAAAGSVVHTTTFRNTRSGTWNIARIEAEAGGQVWAGDLVFKTAASSFANTLVERMRLDENGNLGIGRSSPACPLDVGSASTADNSIIAQFQPTSGSNGLTIRRYNLGADNDRTALYFQNEGVINTRLWVDDTGDVRVSGSTPTSDTSGTVVGTQTFTGTHIYKTDETDLEIGEAVCLVGKKIVRSSSAKSKTVAGIYAGESWKVVDSFGDKCRDADGQPVNGAGHAVIALGDTRFSQSASSSVGVLVDGPVQAGDLLCTSSVPGRLTVQEDDLMHSYTVAKAMEDGDGTAPVYAYVYSG